MSKVYLALGSNIGDCKQNLSDAVVNIKKRVGEVICLSSFYETAPWGFETKNRFQNAVVEVNTSLSAKVLLEILKHIEQDMGRTIEATSKTYADRIIDIDILFFDDSVISTENLTVPHPLLHKRDFVLTPMREIAPSFVHPVLNKTIQQLWWELNLDS